MAAGERHPAAGAICGKLLRWEPAKLDGRTDVIDSTGVYFTRNLRHLDRGSEESRSGQYDRVQYVFAATGAAVIFRRSSSRMFPSRGNSSMRSFSLSAKMAIWLAGPVDGPESPVHSGCSGMARQASDAGAA